MGYSTEPKSIKIMWLPEPVYKSLPTAYAVMGVLFILGVIYLGLDAPRGPLYLGLGLVSILAAITVTMWRGRSASKNQSADSDDAPTS